MNGELRGWHKEHNRQVGKIRWKIEQVIAHFKNWTIMRTSYRRPLKPSRQPSQQWLACTSTG
jgi:hypothetical protein